MTTAEQHRHIAEEFFRMAREAKIEEERKRFFDMALSWSEAAAREDGRFWIGAMTKASQELWEKAANERRRCREWLIPFNDLVPTLSTLVRGRDATG
jgi:hypothetical protein